MKVNYRVLSEEKESTSKESVDVQNHVKATSPVANPIKQCKKGVASHCLILGVLYERGLVGVPQSQDLSAKYYGLACEGKEYLACCNLGMMRERGQGVDRDLEVARRLYEEACMRGEAVGCSHLGSLYERALGVAKNMVKATTLYRRACDSGAMHGCDKLGHAHQYGKGVVKSYTKAAQFYERACRSGRMHSCYQWSWLHAQRCLDAETPLRCLLETTVEAELVPLLLESCMKYKNPVSCAGYASYAESGRFVEAHVVDALKLYEHACLKRLGWGCLGAAGALRRLARGSDGLDRVLAYNQKACVLGFSMGCREAGMMFLNGEGGAPDSKKGVALIQKACDSHDARACLDLKMMCTLGVADACL